MAELADVYMKLGRLHEAKQLEDKGFQIRKRTLGAHHPETLSVQEQQATTLTVMGRWKEAKEC
jgi:hypothetical protein